jgi:hypothetical protein
MRPKPAVQRLAAPARLAPSTPVVAADTAGLTINCSPSLGMSATNVAAADSDMTGFTAVPAPLATGLLGGGGGLGGGAGGGGIGGAPPAAGPPLFPTVSPPIITAAVPEPGGWTLLITGFGVVGGGLRWHRRVEA